MSKRNRPTTAAQATHRRLRHAYRSAYNSPEGKAARGAAGTPAAATAASATKLAAVKRAVAPASPPAPKTPPQG